MIQACGPGRSFAWRLRILRTAADLHDPGSQAWGFPKLQIKPACKRIPGILNVPVELTRWPGPAQDFTRPSAGSLPDPLFP